MTDLAVQSSTPANFIDEWERQPGEPPKAWKAFVIFRDMGEERGVYAVRDRAGFVCNAAVLMRWADKHRWVERAAAYDRMIDRRRQRAHIEEVEAMARRQVHIGQTLQSHGLEWVKENLDTPEKRAAGLNANASLRFIEKGVDLEREGLGMGEKEGQGDTNISITVLDAGTKASVFDKIDEMANNMAAVRSMVSGSVAEPEIVDAEVVEDEQADEDQE